VNYQQDNWTEWLAAAEFQYNDKKHAAAEQTPFELNFGQHPWKRDITMQTEFPKLEEFLIGLQRSCEEAIKAMEKKPTRTARRRKCMVGSQEHSFEQTLKEVGPEKIQIF